MRLRLKPAKPDHRDDGALTPLLRATELADAGAGLHLERVGGYAGATARRLGLRQARCDEIASACRLHDIGKLGVPDAILRKPGALSAPERRAMERHAVIGHEILAGSGSDLLELAAGIALTHHEWFDGGGYPHGLVGDSIPLEGRIAAVSDAFDALTSDRVYRPSVAHSEAAGVLRAASGSQFDPEIVEAFLDALELENVGRPDPQDVDSSAERGIPRQKSDAPASYTGTS